VRGIEQADVELVAHVRPGHFANKLDVEPFGGGEAFVDRDNQGRSVGEWDESDRNFASLAIISTAPQP
jgi:hypothetical protein